jgi:ketosteroid isomerase-like protein
MPATPPIEHLGASLVGLLETGAATEALACLAPGAVLWHNSDKQDVDARAGFAAVTGLHALVEDVGVEVLERAALPDGFLQRYVIRGRVKASGAPLAAHHCIFVRTDGALITRIDEYVDPTLTAQLGLTAEEVSP